MWEECVSRIKKETYFSKSLGKTPIVHQVTPCLRREMGGGRVTLLFLLGRSQSVWTSFHDETTQWIILVDGRDPNSIRTGQFIL